MDHKAVFNIFKKQYMTDGYFSFSLFPILFLEFLKYGADRTILTELFISDFCAFFLPTDHVKVYIKAIECMEYYTKEFLPIPIKKNETHKKTLEFTQKVEVLPNITDPQKYQVKKQHKAVENDKLPDISYNDYIPTDEEEGDGTYIPEDQRLHFKPEECASKQYDWDFINRIGIVGFEENE